MKRKDRHNRRRTRRFLNAAAIVMAVTAAGAVVAVMVVSVAAFRGSDRRPPSLEAFADSDEAQELENQDMKKIAEIFSSFHEKPGGDSGAEDGAGQSDLERLRELITRLGESGYPAVDSGNQIDMVQAAQAERFCEKVDSGQEAEITILEVSDPQSLVRYDLHTENGRVDVTRSCYRYEMSAQPQTSYGSGVAEGGMQGNKAGTLRREITENYPADYWDHSRDGYLMFSGTWFSQEMYVLSMSGTEEHTALRIQPLEEKYRELNRKYILPIGYGRNNMFLTDWNEDDFGALDFYDLYDIFYPRIYGRDVPYPADTNLNRGAVYRIPEEEFEGVLMTCLCIEKETLRAKTTWDPGKEAYEYRPRGFYETEYPQYPFPEVVGAVENADRTITLTVHAVFPHEDLSRAYAHEVVVRPLENGGVEYVSNRVIPSENNCEPTWYTPRLTREEWTEIYAEHVSGPDLSGQDTSGITSAESEYWYFTQAADCLFSDEEKRRLQQEALAAAESVRAIYQEAGIRDMPDLSSGVGEFSAKQRRAVVEELGKNDLVSVEENTNMQNCEKMETFYAAYLRGEDSMVTVFEISKDGLIGSVTFLFRQGRIQIYYTGIRWREGGVPEIQGASVSDVAEIRLTEKGYFFYRYTEETIHTSLRQYWRVSPLSDKCRELTGKYISGLSYVNYNMLVTNWDSDSVEKILTSCMFEDIYHMDTGENLKVKDGQIPAGVYEEIMTAYFPVSREQLRKCCGYDEGRDGYPFERIHVNPYPPFGEVVDYKENEDGTVTLMVDGVWPDYDSDCAFTNQITVRPGKDGRFQYLSNCVQEKELALPVTAGNAD